ncbi:MAG TPA: nucleotidyltransferase domain-containing protein [Candidatus Methanoperedens sp.]|nr:nucleotidyltransferase domain-containing protein [Candidatus Methanoperedens sp.]
MDELSRAVARTKKYADKYGQKLDDKQLFLRLISKKVFHFFEIKNKGETSNKKNYWKYKVKLAESLVKTHLSKMKGIKLVGITGSAASEAAKQNEDIDILIVTRGNELWWWRFYLRFYVWWQKIPHRRFNKTQKKDEFCFNLWLDDLNLTIPLEKRNLKNASDMIMMKVIFDKESCYQEMLYKNRWVEKYLATGYRERMKIDRIVDKKINSKVNNENYFIKKAINRILFWGQYLYMWSKVRKKIRHINEGQAFFHKND